MGHVYVMITTMELTAQVNQYFCYLIVNSFENVILLHQNLKLMWQLLFFVSSFIVVCEAATNCSGHGTCRADGTCECDSQFFEADCTSKLQCFHYSQI